MLQLILIAIIAFILIILIRLTYQFNDIAADGEQTDEHAIVLPHGYVYSLIIICIASMLFLAWSLMKGSLWEAHFMEWLNIIVRLAHVTFGIAWIGASFYFVWLENALKH